MTLSKNELQVIADTLPIGYYAKARVSVAIDENAETSYFMPTTRQIFVSLQGVNTSLAKIDESDPAEAEKAVRAHLYHELSHAILTPNVMQPTDAINVFEDERIETLLADYYHKVDFKANIKALCDFDGKPPRNPFEKFFYACRFRIGKKEWLDEVDRIINDFSHLNWNSNDTESRGKRVYDYTSAIESLYYRITHENVPRQEWQKMIDDAMKAQNQQGQGQNPQANVPKEYQPNAAEQGNTAGASGDEQTQAESAPPQEGQGQGAQTKEKGHGVGEGLIEKAFDQAFAEMRDNDLYSALDDILQNYAKKNKGGSAMQTYSGVFNPRNCMRDDFRYFDRMSSVHGSNSYGSLNLNVFIDNSGSFDSNQKKANQVLATLCDLERKYPFFSVDIAFCGDEVQRVKKHEAYLTTDECTGVQTEAIAIVKKMQKPNTYNYNIVLYDGRASYNHHEMRCAYEPWDMSNSTLILDPSCEAEAKKVHNAKVIISNNYLHDLSKNIILTLQRAFR